MFTAQQKQGKNNRANKNKLTEVNDDKKVYKKSDEPNMSECKGLHTMRAVNRPTPPPRTTFLGNTPEKNRSLLTPSTINVHIKSRNMQSLLIQHIPSFMFNFFLIYLFQPKHFQTIKLVIYFRTGQSANQVHYVKLS